MVEFKVSARQQKFVTEYLVDRNATAAARRAGYSKESAKDLISNPRIQLAILRAISDHSELRRSKADRLLEYLERAAYRNPMTFVRWAAKAGSLEEAPDLPEELAGCVEATLEESSRGKLLRVRLKDNTPALRLLAQHVVVFIPYEGENQIGEFPDDIIPDPDDMTPEQKAATREAIEEVWDLEKGCWKQ